MGSASAWILAASIVSQAAASAIAQDAKQLVQQAVQTEAAADRNDHSHWIYFETDMKPDHPVKQWVAEAVNGNLRRVMEIDGHKLTPDEQRKRMESYLADSGQQTKQRKGEQHDDKQAEEMLHMLPQAFIWTRIGERGSNTLLHFRPDPNFRPPDMETRVFAAMEGDMSIDTRQHRIVSLKGKLIHDVKIFGGLLGALNAGGTFDVERRETAPGIWQITETHVHIQGHILLFKTISEQEDDVKTHFRLLPDRITMQEAKKDLLAAE